MTSSVGAAPWSAAPTHHGNNVLSDDASAGQNHEEVVVRELQVQPGAESVDRFSHVASGVSSTGDMHMMVGTCEQRGVHRSIVVSDDADAGRIYVGPCCQARGRPPWRATSSSPGCGRCWRCIPRRNGPCSGWLRLAPTPCGGWRIASRSPWRSGWPARASGWALRRAPVSVCVRRPQPRRQPAVLLRALRGPLRGCRSPAPPAPPQGRRRLGRTMSKLRPSAAERSLAVRCPRSRVVAPARWCCRPHPGSTSRRRGPRG